MSQTKAQLIEGLNINTSAPADALSIDSSGKVGVGTTSPADNLTVSGSSGAVNLGITANTSNAYDSPSLKFLGGNLSTSSILFGDASDADVGKIIYNHDGNSLAFTVNASERLRIDSSGRLGIGTTSPSGLLHLAASSEPSLYFEDTGSSNTLSRIYKSGSSLTFNSRHTSAGQFVFNSENSGGTATERMRIDSSGRLLLGTTTEGHPNLDDLTIATTGHTGITIRSGTSHDGQIGFSDGTSGDDEYRGQVLYNHGSNSMRFITDASERMRIDSSGRLLVGGTNTYHANADDLVVQGTGKVGVTIASTNSDTSNIYFADSTSNPGTYACYFEYDHVNDALKIGQGNNERLRLDSAGRVMLGTATPGVADADQLTIASGSSTGITIRGSTSGNGNVFFSDTTSGTGQYDGFIQYQHSSRALKFGTAAAEKMRVSSSGQVMIGTTTAGNGAADDLTIASSGNTGISIRSSSSTAAAIYFADGTSGAENYQGIVQYYHGSDALQFYTNYGANSNPRMLIDSSGRLMLGTSTTRAGGFAIAKGFSSSGVPAAGTSTSSLLVGNDDGGSYGLAMGANGSGNGYIQAQRSDGSSTIYDLYLQPNGGKVSIGTTAATAVLNVYGGASATLYQNSNTGTGSGDGFFVGNWGGLSGSVWNYENDIINFGTNNTERMRIQNDGVVRIQQTGVNTLRVQNSTSSGANMLFQNSTTGLGAGNGFFVGIGDGEASYVWNYHNEPLVFATNNTERFRVNTGGTVLIGKTVANASGSGAEIRTAGSGQLILGKTFSGTVNGVFFNHNTAYVGGLNYSNTGTSLVTSSDYRLKENIVAVPNAIERAKQLNPVRFNFIIEPNETVEGFIAHELGQVIPEACCGEKDAVNEDGSVKPQTIAQEKIIPLLTAALQEAIAKIETLEGSNADLLARVTALEAG